MEHTSIGTQKLRRVGNSLVITIPKQAAEQLGLSDGDLVDIQLAPMELRPRMRPEVRASFEAVLPTIQPALDYLKDR